MRNGEEEDLVGLFDRFLLEISTEDRYDCESTIQRLQELLNNNLPRDHDHWLASSVHGHQALVLEEAGRLDEALEVYHRRKATSLHPTHLYENQMATAGLLFRMKRDEEAIHELEEGLSSSTARSASASETLGLLSLYAVVSMNLKHEVPQRYSTMLRRLRDEFDCPASTDVEDEPLADQIVDLRHSVKQAQTRYLSLQEQLRGQSSSDGTRILERYIEAEPVGKFREYAREQLNMQSGDERTR